MYWSAGTSGRARLWQALAALEPAAVGRRTLAEAEPGGYSLGFLGRRYRVEPESRRIGGPQADPLLQDEEFELLLLAYLIQAADIPAEGTWISEKDLPGGSLFFRGPHALPLQPLLTRFGGDLAGFRSAAEALAGSPLPYGDAAYSFSALPRISAGCLLWVGDEEFPARAGLLFDRSLARHLPLDVVLALAHCLVARLLEAAGPAGPAGRAAATATR
jgi:hypothetical protein